MTSEALCQHSSSLFPSTLITVCHKTYRCCVARDVIISALFRPLCFHRKCGGASRTRTNAVAVGRCVAAPSLYAPRTASWWLRHHLWTKAYCANRSSSLLSVAAHEPGCKNWRRQIRIIRSGGRGKEFLHVLLPGLGRRHNGLEMDDHSFMNSCKATFLPLLLSPACSFLVWMCVGEVHPSNSPRSCIITYF